MPLTDLPLTPETEATLDLIIHRIESASRIQVIGHVRPDGDCIGSLLGMHHILAHYQIEHALAAGSIQPNGYEAFAGFSLIESAPRVDFDPDLTIFVDCAGLDRAIEDWEPEGSTINIDHHGSNTRFGDLNWIDPKSAAVGEMIYYFARYAQVPLNPDFANALLLAIMTVSGSFRYSNVGPYLFDVAGELLRAGADVVFIGKAAYESRTPESIAVMGQVLSSIHYHCGGELVWAEIDAATIRRVGGAANLPDNLASEIRGIKGVRVSILFLELPEGGLRASLRGDGSVDVSALAANFGGGGHPNAAGITLKQGDFRPNRDKIIAKAEEDLTRS